MTTSIPINNPGASLSGKWRNIALLAIAVLFAKTMWFSASAVIPQLSLEWGLDPGQKSWMTMSVQLGFVAGCLFSALLNLSDRYSSRYILSASALMGTLCNLAIPLLSPGIAATLALRFLTGASIAGVYPPGMKLIATWCKEDRGLGIGVLIGALTLGASMPHLLNVIPVSEKSGMPPWRMVMFATSLFAFLGAAVAAFFIKEGPYLSQQAPFNWRFATLGLRHKPTRLANFGYLGHMWELYAMWTWVPLFIMASYEKSGLGIEAARLAGFGVIAVGFIGCVLAGIMADRMGRTTITIWSLAASGICALIIGLFFNHPITMTVITLIWGIAVVADSAQFSTAISELTDTRYVGTMLTIQTSLGFLLTLLSIRIIPVFVDLLGWDWVFAILAIGPAAGIWSMYRLRQMPESVHMASGNR